jgi:DNA helicase-2/ATP-dependent DNA helicase PcrA
MDSNETLRAILETPYRLFEQQRAAVMSPKRYVRIVAGAGAGKTETLTRRIAYLLLCKEEQPASIVAFTFTERAAQSMKNRVYQRVAQLKGEEACARLGEMYIGTIHGYCMRLLQDYFGYGNFDVLDENQEMAFLMRMGRSLGLGGRQYSKRCGEFSRSVSLVYDELLDRETLQNSAPDFFERLEKYEALLEQHKLLTYAQMIAKAVEGLETDKRAVSTVRHLIVDEYQDINKAQARLIELIGASSTLFVVGDPRQCIYRWRGSDEGYFDKFSRVHKGTHEITMCENTRSCPEIVTTANQFAASFKTAKYEPLKPVRTNKGNVCVVECETDASEAEWVTTQVNRLVNKGKVCNLSDIAILLRSVSTSAEPFIDACKSKGIPYLVGGKVGLFRRDEAQVMGRLYAWLAKDGFWLLNPFTWETIQGDSLIDTAASIWKDLLGLKRFPVSEVMHWKERVLNGDFKHFTETYHNLLVILGFHHLKPENKSHAPIMANLGRFNALLTDYESSMRRGGESVDWQNVWTGLVWYMNSYASGAYEEQPADDLRGVDALQIMTVHQAKGLEWPVVFIPCVTSKRFPSSRARSGQRPSCHVPEELFDAERYAGGIEDERKLFYVAMTRSRDLCCISFHNRIRNHIGKSEFLSQIGRSITAITERTNIPAVKISRPGEQDEIQTFSGGEIIEYLRCPYFYRLREQWNYQAGLDPALGYGKSLHHCLRIASENIKRGAEPSGAIADAVDAEFHLPYAGSTARNQMLRKARDTLAKFATQHVEDVMNIEEVEARLEFPMHRATITGRVDVILKRRERPVLEVRDYKTSDEVTTLEESSLQVRLYTLGLRKMGRPVEKASIAYLDTGEIKSVDVSPRSLEEAKKIAESCIKDMTALKYRGKGKSKCACDYNPICFYLK